MKPSDTPLEKWPPGWLKMETASLLDMPGYIIMHDHEKKYEGLPVTNTEMIAFIKARREADALLAPPDAIRP